MIISFADGVLEEIADQAVYLGEIDGDLADRFLDACEAAFNFLLNNPHAGSSRDFKSAKLSNVRMWRIKGFEKHLVFYVPTVNGIRILHLVHSAMDYNRVFDEE